MCCSSAGDSISACSTQVEEGRQSDVMFTGLGWCLLVLILRTHLLSSAPIPADVGQSSVTPVEAEPRTEGRHRPDEVTPSHEEPAEKLFDSKSVVPSLLAGAAIEEQPHYESTDNTASAVSPEFRDDQDVLSEGPVEVTEFSENSEDAGVEEEQTLEESVADVSVLDAQNQVESTSPEINGHVEALENDLLDDCADVEEQLSCKNRVESDPEDVANPPPGAPDENTSNVVTSAELQGAENPSEEDVEIHYGSEKESLHQQTEGEEEFAPLEDINDDSSPQKRNEEESLCVELVVDEDGLVTSAAEGTEGIHLDEEDLVHIVPLVSAEDDPEPQAGDPIVICSEESEDETEPEEEFDSELITLKNRDEQEADEDYESVLRTGSSAVLRVQNIETDEEGQEEVQATNGLAVVEELEIEEEAPEEADEVPPEHVLDDVFGIIDGKLTPEETRAVVAELPTDVDLDPGEPGAFAIEERFDEEPAPEEPGPVVIGELTDKGPVPEEPGSVTSEGAVGEQLAMLNPDADVEGVTVQELVLEEPDPGVIVESTDEKLAPEDPVPIVIEEFTDIELVPEEPESVGSDGPVDIQPAPEEHGAVIEGLADPDPAPEEPSPAVVEKFTDEEPDLTVIEELPHEEPAPEEPGYVNIQELTDDELDVEESGAADDQTNKDSAPEEPTPSNGSSNVDSFDPNPDRTSNESIFEEPTIGAPLNSSLFVPVVEPEAPTELKDAERDLFPGEEKTLADSDTDLGTTLTALEILIEDPSEPFAPPNTGDGLQTLAAAEGRIRSRVVIQKTGADAPKNEDPVVKRGAVLGIAFFTVMCFIISGFVGTAVSKKLRGL